MALQALLERAEEVGQPRGGLHRAGLVTRVILAAKRLMFGHQTSRRLRWRVWWACVRLGMFVFHMVFVFQFVVSCGSMWVLVFQGCLCMRMHGSCRSLGRQAPDLGRKSQTVMLGQHAQAYMDTDSVPCCWRHHVMVHAGCRLCRQVSAPRLGAQRESFSPSQIITDCLDATWTGPWSTDMTCICRHLCAGTHDVALR